GGVRCLVRLGEDQLVAEWRAKKLPPIERPGELAVSNLALREERTIAVGDVDGAPELNDVSLVGVEELRALGSRSVVATPILVLEHAVGVLAVHRDEPHIWRQGELALLESLAAEAGLAVQLGRLLAENRERLTAQTALLRAAQVL